VSKSEDVTDKLLLVLVGGGACEFFLKIDLRGDWFEFVVTFC